MDANTMDKLATLMQGTNAERAGALLAAAAFVDEMTLPKQNERGYRDGIWSDPSQRLVYIIKVADWLLRPTGKLIPPPPPSVDRIQAYCGRGERPHTGHVWVTSEGHWCPGDEVPGRPEPTLPHGQ